MVLNIPDTQDGVLVFGISAFILALASSSLIGLILGAFPLLNRLRSAPAARVAHSQPPLPVYEQDIAEGHHIAAISAALAAMVGPHRIVHIEPIPPPWCGVAGRGPGRPTMALMLSLIPTQPSVSRTTTQETSMERKFKITVDGRQYSVTVEEQSDFASLPHLEHSAFVAPSAPHPLTFAHANSGLASHPAPAPAATVARGPAEPGDVISPLSGVVELVPVTVGQEIGEGDCVLVVEAMKMKTPVIAGWAGKVASILVNVGDGVQTGQVLAKIA